MGTEELAGRLTQHSAAAALLAEGVRSSTDLMGPSLARHFGPADRGELLDAMADVATALDRVSHHAARLAILAGRKSR